MVSPKIIHNVILAIKVSIYILISSLVLIFYGMYIYPMQYSYLQLKLSYIIGIILIGMIYFFWNKFIKRKLHFLISIEGYKI